MGIVPGARAVVAAALIWSSVAGAQWRAEAGAAFVRDAGQSVEVGGGLMRPIGIYLRAGLTVAGQAWSASDTATAHLRAEGLIRFLLDPVAQQRWGVSVGAGLGYRERLYLATVIDLEGPTGRVLRPAFQVALGAGARVGVVIRRSSPHQR